MNGGNLQLFQAYVAGPEPFWCKRLKFSKAICFGQNILGQNKRHGRYTEFPHDNLILPLNHSLAGSEWKHYFKSYSNDSGLCSASLSALFNTEYQCPVLQRQAEKDICRRGVFFCFVFLRGGQGVELLLLLYLLWSSLHWIKRSHTWNVIHSNHFRRQNWTFDSRDFPGKWQ